MAWNWCCSGGTRRNQVGVEYEGDSDSPIKTQGMETEVSMNPDCTLGPEDLVEANILFETEYLNNQGYEPVTPEVAMKEKKN